jgi:hypothetical protein
MPVFRKLFAAVFLLIGFASFAQAEVPGQLSLVEQTCTRVMGLKAGETYFALCRQNLSDAAVAAGQNQPAAYTGDNSETGKSFYEVSPMHRWNREQAACVRIGLRPGSTVFHQCVAGLDAAFLPRLN